MRILLLTLIIAAFSSLFAQSSECAGETTEAELKKAVESYEYCLQHSNKGVVESTIANVIRFKSLHPEYNTDQLSDELEAVTKNGDSESIRFKAFLASQFLNNNGLFSQLNNRQFDGDEQLFMTVAAHMQNKLLTSR